MLWLVEAETHYRAPVGLELDNADQSGLSLRNLPAFASQVLELKIYANTSSYLTSNLDQTFCRIKKNNNNKRDGCIVFL